MTAGLLLMCVIVQAQGADLVFKAPRVEDLGFTRRVYSEGTDRDIIEYADMQTGRVIRQHYDPTKSVEWVEVLDEHGKMLSRRYNYSDRLVLESWESGHRRRTLEPRETYGYNVTDEVIDDANPGHTKITRSVTGPMLKGDGSCPTPDPITIEQMDTLVQHTDYVLGFYAGSASKATHGYVPLDNNSRLLGCGDYPAREHTTGEAALAEDISDAIDIGTKCMARLLPKTYPKSPQIARLRTEMAQLLGYFDRRNASLPFTFTCDYMNKGDGSCQGPKDPSMQPDGSCNHGLYLVGQPAHSDAMAVTCKTRSTFGHPVDYPGMVINADHFRDMPAKERKGSIFHEMLHLLGYQHAEDSDHYDLVYAAEWCCFDDQDESKPHPSRKSMCKDLASKTPGDPI